MERKPTRDFMDMLVEKHHRLPNLDPDPLIFARGFNDALEGEAAGLVASSFAYGNVRQIVKTLSFVFDRLSQNPRAALLDATTGDLKGICAGFCYRFHKEADLALYLLLLKRALEENPSLKAIFCEGLSKGGDTGEALGWFCEKILSGDPRPLLGQRTVPTDHPVRFLLSSPASGGAAKRMCLFLRWMARRDELDPGYWQGAIPRSRLVVPLDVHVARVGRFFGFTSLKSAGWRTALQITEALREYDPEDPLKYDFSLFRYGMEEFFP